MRLGPIAVMLAGLMSAPAAAGTPQNLLLEIWVNGRTQHQVATVQSQGGVLIMARADLTNAGLLLPPDKAPRITLSSLQGVAAQIDETAQQLRLRVPPKFLVPQVFDLRPSLVDDAADTVPARGTTLAYDASFTSGDVRRGSRAMEGGAALGLMVYSPVALFTTTGFVRYDGTSHGARQDTALAFDDPASLNRLVFGDAISGSLDWSRAVRFGGIHFASDFSLRPDLVTVPMPDFFGEAAVPQAIDVYSNGASVFAQDIDPGPFEIHNIPVVTGGGSATVTIRDVLGRQTTQTLSLYTTNDLLAPGLSSYAFDLGFLRRGYGFDSFNYGTPLAMTTFRHGLSKRLTIEAHTEASPHRALGGLGATLSLGQFAGFSGALSLGGATNGNGFLGSASLEARGGPFTLFASAAASDSDYRDVASLDGARPDRLRAQIGVTTDFGHAGVWGVNWIRTRQANRDTARLLTSSYMLDIGHGVYFGLSGLRDFTTRQWAAEAFLSLSLSNITTSASLTSNNGRVMATGSVARPVDPDGGLGYRMLASAGAARRIEGDVSWIGTHQRADAGIALTNSRIAVRADIGGALVFLNGSIFSTRDPGDAVALVKTGRPGVHITRENRTVAVSDENGEALLTGLVPYAPNRIGVETRDYAMSDVLNDSERKIAPRRSSAVMVDFTPLSQQPALVTVVTAAGAPPPVGARVDVAGSRTPLIVGRAGQIYFADLDHDVTATVTDARGRCTFRASPRDAAPGAMVLIGPVLCAGERRAS